MSRVCRRACATDTVFADDSGEANIDGMEEPEAVLQHDRHHPNKSSRYDAITLSLGVRFYMIFTEINPSRCNLLHYGHVTPLVDIPLKGRYTTGGQHCVGLLVCEWITQRS